MAKDDSESGTVEGKAGFSEHIDNPIVFLILITIGVCALMGVGRWLGNSSGKPGVTAFFGG